MTPADRREREQLIEEGHMAMGKPPGMTIVGGKPGDVPRFVPDDELNTGPRDERGHLKAGEPQTLEARLAKLFDFGNVTLDGYTLSKRDCGVIARALRAQVKL